MKISDIKKFYIEHEDTITPAARFVRLCFSYAAQMRESTNIADYINLALSCKDAYTNIYQHKNPHTYFQPKKWDLLLKGQSAEYYIDLITSSAGRTIRPLFQEDGVRVFSVEIEEIKFGWVIYHDQDYIFYVEKNSNYKKIINQLIWKKYGNNIILGFENGKTFLQEDKKNQRFTPTVMANKFINSIQLYLAGGEPRSILFYGPSGSGKSNMIKNICSELQLKTLRINNISDISFFANQLIEDSSPEAIIIEDIDHCNFDDVSKVLSKLEDLNKTIKLCFATANKLSLLDDAVIRPERFDRMVKIDHLDEEIIRDLVGNDEEIFSLVKDWPVVSINELMKRIKIEGKKQAMSEYQDIEERVNRINQSSYGFDEDKNS